MRERTAEGSQVIRFRVDVADAIAAKKGLTTTVEKAAFFGLNRHSHWTQITSGTHKPGEGFIARVLSSPAKDEFPDEVTFDNLFEVA